MFRRRGPSFTLIRLKESALMKMSIFAAIGSFFSLLIAPKHPSVKARGGKERIRRGGGRRRIKKRK